MDEGDVEGEPGDGLAKGCAREEHGEDEAAPEACMQPGDPIMHSRGVSTASPSRAMILAIVIPCCAGPSTISTIATIILIMLCEPCRHPRP